EILSQQRHEITQLLYYYFKISSNELPDNKPNVEEYDSQKIHLISLLASNNIIKIYEHILAINNAAFFHITLIPIWWYKNEKMHNLDLDEQLYINTCTIEPNEDYLSCPKLRGDDVFSPEVRHAVQKQHDYGETFNLAQKAVQNAVESGGDSFYCLKRSLNNWFAKEKRLSYIRDDDQENFDPSQVENLIKKQHRRRSSTK
ncbi:21875_t:CDS:2, partial [Dentiscutata erythropus]